MIKSTNTLTIRLQKLRNESLQISEQLTSSLSSSKSGQTLLQLTKHLTDVPDLTDKIERELSTIQNNLQEYNAGNVEGWVGFYNEVMSVRLELRRLQSLQLCHDKCCALESCEAILVQHSKTSGNAAKNNENVMEDFCMKLERCAFTALNLSEELKYAPTSVVGMMQQQQAAVLPAAAKIQSPLLISSEDAVALPQDLFEDSLPPDKDRAQFFMRLAPRIRRLEGDVTRALTEQLENVLTFMNDRGDNNGNADGGGNSSSSDEEIFLGAVGHCLRGLAINGRGKDAESTFARIAIM